MAYTSPLYPGEVVVHDSTSRVVTHDPHYGRGLDLSPRPREGYAYGAAADPFPSDLVIPKSEWQARIEELDKTQTRLSDLIVRDKIPPHDQDGINYCVPAGTLIRMADGSEKRIEDVRVLDEVVTAEGRTGKVLKTIVRHVTEPLLTPVIWGHSHLRATAEHPILTKRGYVKLCDLEPGDMVAFPRYAAKSSTLLQSNEFLFERNYVRQSRRTYRNHHDQIQSISSRSVRGRTAGVITTSMIPDLIHLTHGFGRIIGFFLSEGHTSGFSVCWSFNIKEKDTFAAEVYQLLQTELGAASKLKVRPNNVVQVQIYGLRWAKLFEAICGRGAGGKGLHAVLTSGPVEFLQGVLTGWMDGDRQRGNYGVTISRELALNMFDVANVSGYMPVLSTHQREHLGNDGQPRKHAWKVGWGENSKVNYRATQDETHLWRKVCDIDSEPFIGHVFNIKVEGDNSYVAEGIGVHNCWIHGPTGAVEVVRTCIQNQPYVALSATSAGCIIKGFKNQGGWGKEGLEFIATRGVVPQSLWPENKLQKSYDTPENWEEAKKHVCTEWWELRPRNMDELISCLLLRIPVAVGYNWWTHEVYACDAVWKDGTAVIRIRNSWGNWGDNGFGLLEGGKAVPDDAVAPRVMVAA